MKKRFILGKNWFFEDLLPSEKLDFVWGIPIKKEIYSGKSPFQKIEIFDTEKLGRILVLDGRVQLSTKHEFKYHEMLVLPAMFFHPSPQRVLIIGGGDGGALREIVKMPVKEVYLVDIDRKVVELSKRYLPSVSAGSFNDRRLKLFHEDGLKFVKKYKNFFDVIFIDSTDEAGPSEPLFKKGFYRNVFRSLKRNGIMAAQTGFTFDKWGIAASKRIAKIFPFSERINVFVECYPSGVQTFFIGSKKINLGKINLKKIKTKFKKLKIKTKYYSPEIHFASTILP